MAYHDEYGMRASDVLNLEEDCLIFNEKENIHHLSYMSHKTLNQRRRAGLDDYHSIPVLSKEPLM